MSYEGAFQHHSGISTAPLFSFQRHHPLSKGMRILESSKLRVHHRLTIESTTPGGEDRGHVLPLNPLYTNFPRNEQNQPSPNIQQSNPARKKRAERGEVSLKTKIQLLSTRIAPPQGSLQAAQDGCRCRLLHMASGRLCLLSPRVVYSITPVTLVSISSRLFQYAHLTHP